MRPVLPAILLLAGLAPARAAAPVVAITDPATFTLTQGALSAQIQAVERAESAASFYDYFSASSHTGFEAPHESKLFLYRDTTTGALSLFITHNIDLDSSGILTGPGAVTFDLGGVPPGAFVAQSDDPNQFGRAELDLAFEPEGLWNYSENTDGGVIDGLPLDEPWCITVEPLLFSNVDSWVYHFSSGQPIALDMGQTVTICYEVPQVDQIDVDEGLDVSLAGSFDDQDAFDTHVATWTFGDSQSAPGVFSPGVGFTHHDLEPVFHPYGDDGLYDAELSVVDGNGDEGSDLVVVNVHNVAPSVAYTGPLSFQAGVAAALTADASDPGSDDIGFDWDFGDGSPISSSVHFNDGVGPDPVPSPLGTFPFQATDVQQHVYCDEGPIFIVVVARDDDGATSGTIVQGLVEPGPGCNQPPTCDAGPDVEAPCWDAKIGADASDPEGFPLAIGWSSDDCPDLSFTPPDALAVSVVASDCEATCTLTLTVTDVEGASCSDSLTVTFGTRVPEVLACPAPAVVECDGAGNLAERAAWIASFVADACSPALSDELVELTQHCGGSQEIRRFVVRDACAREASCTSTFDIVDTTPPTIVEGAIAACHPSAAAAEAAALAATSASDACSEPVALAVAALGTCGTTVVVTATDACGNETSVSYPTIIDAEAPVLSVPGDETVSCSGIPEPAAVGASDACDPDPVITMEQVRVDGPCVDAYALHRTWTATDRCGNASSATQVIAVVDGSAPVLVGVPDDTTAGCDAVPPPAMPWASDDCDPSPDIALVETIVEGGCVDAYELHRTWTATDHCGNAVSLTQVLGVSDSLPPALQGVPADIAVDCSALPAPPPVVAIDDCDPSPVVGYVESRVDGPCAGNGVLTRTWTADDRCGNRSSRSQSIEVTDTQPPVVEAGFADAHCLWPPNHRMVCFGQGDFAPSIAEGCSQPVTWRFMGCASDQPDDGLGDGSTTNDCQVSADGGTLCVRSERQGMRPEGRRYAVSIVAVDACGNASDATIIASILVPHDQDPRATCRRPARRR